MATDFEHPGPEGSSARIAALSAEPIGSPFGAPSPELHATTGENSGLKIPVSGVQFPPCPPFFCRPNARILNPNARISSWSSGGPYDSVGRTVIGNRIEIRIEVSRRASISGRPGNSARQAGQGRRFVRAGPGSVVSGSRTVRKLGRGPLPVPRLRVRSANERHSRSFAGVAPHPRGMGQSPPATRSSSTWSRRTGSSRTN